MTTQFFPDVINAYPVTAPYVAGIPGAIKQGDSGQWLDQPFTDSNGIGYSSADHTLTYVIAGLTAPLSLTAIPSGSAWQTNISMAQSAALVPGPYWWEVQVSAPAVRWTVASGKLTVTPDLARQQAGFDQRTVAEIALANAEAALATFQASGARVLGYQNGTRHMNFQTDETLIAVVNYWRSRVLIEQTKRQGARSRMILARFGRAR